MEKKDLAEDYLVKAKENAIYFKGGKFPNMPLFQESDIKAAFNAGRESVVKDMPELEWIDGLNIVDEFEEVFCEECITTTPFGEYSIRYFYYSKTYVLFFADEKVSNDFKLLNDIKLFAEKDYKTRIKQALGL